MAARVGEIEVSATGEYNRQIYGHAETRTAQSI